MNRQVETAATSLRIHRPVFDESYFIRKIFVKNNNEYKTVGYSKEALDSALKILKENRESIKKDLDILDDETLAEKLLPDEPGELSTRLSLPSGNVDSVHVRRIPPDGLIINKGEGTILVVCKNIEDVKQLILDIKDKFYYIDAITKDFGLNLTSFLTSRELTESRVKKSKSFLSFKVLKPKNEFEKEMLRSLEKITDCYLSNIEVAFSEPQENFEYDAIVCFGDNMVFDIELKDYNLVNEEIHYSKITESLKSKIVLNVHDKALRMQAEPIVVVNNFPSDVYKSIAELAQSRNVTLLESRDVERSLKNHFLTKLLAQDEPRRSPRLFSRLRFDLST